MINGNPVKMTGMGISSHPVTILTLRAYLLTWTFPKLYFQFHWPHQVDVQLLGPCSQLWKSILYMSVLFSSCTEVEFCLFPCFVLSIRTTNLNIVLLLLFPHKTRRHIIGEKTESNITAHLRNEGLEKPLKYHLKHCFLLKQKKKS